jgi:uncharacterized membrane protein (DUF106 family)
MKSDFLKLSRLKISLFFALTILSFIFTVASSIYGFFCEPICPFMEFYWLIFVALFLLSLIINYILSCFIVWFYYKLKKVKNNEL